MADFTGRVALVTGASRGIGFAVAQALAEAGAHVFLLARTQGALEELYDIIHDSGGQATGVPMDLSDGAAVDRLGAHLAERFGRLDILIGNAAILGPITPIAHIAPDRLEEILRVNVTANARLIRALDPLLMQADAPRAVFVTSGAAQKARPFWGAYASSKAALDALILTWAREHENDALRVNLISPGAMRTAMRAAAMPGEDPDSLPHPNEIAPLFLKLCAANYTKTAEIVAFQPK